MTRTTLALLAAASLSIACAKPPIQPTPAPSNARAELWAEPPARRDLFYGPGGAELAPPAAARFTVKTRDPRGFSTTLDLVDATGREWSAKIGPEAQAEVVASRLVWALGYHQPPSYFVAELDAVEDGKPVRETHVRLRPKLDWLDSQDVWSWHQNPFVGTQPYRGLLVLMMMLNSTDLKGDNNALYLVKQPGRQPRHWYVVKDLGASLGTTGKLYPQRNDVDEFERHGFVKEVVGRNVEFEFAGRHQELLQHLTVGDVRWISRRLARLTDRQWDDAFRAAGYPEEVRRRYIAKMKAKIAEGLSLRPTRDARTRGTR
jgi:hypothetical protein